MFGCPCSDKGGEWRVETQWPRGQPSLSLSLSRAAFSLAVARGRSLPGPLYHTLCQAEKLVLAHVQKSTGPLHQRATRDVNLALFWTVASENELISGVFAGEELDAAQDQTAQRGAWAQRQQDEVSGFIHVFLFTVCVCVSVFFCVRGWGHSSSCSVENVPEVCKTVCGLFCFVACLLPSGSHLHVLFERNVTYVS